MNPIKLSATLFVATAISAMAGGSISGKVQSKPHADEEKIVSKNSEQCGAKIKVRKYVVGAGGSVQFAVASLPGVAGGSSKAPADIFYDNVGCHFEPHVLIAPLGATLKVRNSDDMLHNSHFFLMDGATKKNLVNLALPKKGQVIENTKILRKEGLVSVQCDAHEFMQGYIWVLPNGFGAVTGADGNFKLTDVPPGTHSLKIWHEALGEKVVKVTVEEGKEAKVSIDL